MSAWPRQVLPPNRRVSDSNVAVFCGIYGPRWVDNAFTSLERQSTSPVQVVLALNGRDEQTLAKLVDYQASSRHEVWVAVNEQNIGPLGSYERNRDLIQAAWTAFMHQDDEYLSAHLAVIRNMALHATGDVCAVFTSLGGVSEDGRRRMTAPPMKNSHLRGARPWVLVPEIIRRHPYPTPAAAVRSDRVVSGMAWYDSGAPDSEWFARLACLGTMDSTDEVTVLYRQPADSESSRTDWSTRAWLWSASVDRILSSSEFGALLDTMPQLERTPFAIKLLDAIPARYPASDLFRYLQFMAAQRMCEAWSYREPVPLDFVTEFLGRWGQTAAVTSLESLGGRRTAEYSVETLEPLLGVEPHRSRAETWGRTIYRRYAHLMPPSVREEAVAIYRRIRRGAS